jgi:hypothetical protein
MTNPLKTIRWIAGCGILFACGMLGACVNITKYSANDAAVSTQPMTAAEARDVVQRWMVPEGRDRVMVVRRAGESTRSAAVSSARLTSRNLILKTRDNDIVVFPLAHIFAQKSYLFCSQGPQGDGVPGCTIRLGDAPENSAALYRKGNDPQDVELGKQLVDALAELQRTVDAPPSPEEQARFADVAQAYRAAHPKPLRPEALVRFQVQAEGAVRDKDFAEAEDYFAQGLQIAPWWPDGHYNRAVVLAETGDYAPATVEMQRYLLLAPEASNAREAQNMIYDWQRKAQ